MSRDLPPRPGFSFPGPVPREALEYFRGKDLRPGFSYLDVWGQEHAHAFTVAKALQLDVLDDLRDGVERAIAEGRTYRQFAGELTPLLQKRGWWGEREQLDPLTGERRIVQLGSPRRLRTIYRANLRSARAAGQWARVQRTKTTHPYLQYRLGPSETHRTQHAKWNGTILPVDDPWWRDHYPPNGWGCKCWVRAVSRREAERLGGATSRPARNPVEWTNKRTGEVLTVDRGLDPAWASNPGRDRARSVRESLNGKIDSVDPHLARGAVDRVRDSALLDRQLAPMKRGDPPLGDLPVAFLDRDLAAPLGAKTQLVRLTRETARKQRKRHRELTPGDYRDRLPAVLRHAQVVLEETGHNDRSGRDLVFFHFGEDGQLWKAVVSAENERRARLTTFYKSGALDLEEALKRGKVVRDLRN